MSQRVKAMQETVILYRPMGEMNRNIVGLIEVIAEYKAELKRLK